MGVQTDFSCLSTLTFLALGFLVGGKEVGLFYDSGFVNMLGIGVCLSVSSKGMISN